MVSLQLCFMGWAIELIGALVVVITPMLYDLGFLNVYYINVILLFLLIPFLHLMNNEDTKGIISEFSWYQGMRHLMGCSPHRVSPQRNPSPRTEELKTMKIFEP